MMLDLTGYKLTFDDEFNTRSISQGAGTTWSDIRAEWRVDANSDIGFGQSSFVDASSGYDPFSVENGALTITASPDSTPSGASGAWESGLINTKNSFSQTYGYFEVRADLSDSFGAWDAFWMLPVTQTPPQPNGGWKELDIVEHYGENNAGAYRWVHTTQGPDQQVTTGHSTQVSGYHTYGMDWQPDKISFYHDGQLAGSTPAPSDMNEPMYMLFNLAVDKTPIESSLSSKIDYIRAYSNHSGANAVALDTISSPDGANTSDLHGAIAANSGAPQKITSAPSTPASASQPSAATAPPKDTASNPTSEATAAIVPSASVLTTSVAAQAAVTPAVAPTPATGSGDIKLVVSGDHFSGAPQFQVFVDGTRVGETYTVSADHKAGDYETFNIDAGLKPGQHDIEVRFINDAYDGVNDRNLYVASIEANGQSIPGAAAANFGQWNHVPVDPAAAVLLSSGGLHFQTSTTVSSQPTATTPTTAGPSTQAAAAPAVTTAKGTDGDLHLVLSGDHFGGAPQFQVFVDSKQIGGTYSISADHAAGAYEKFDFNAGLTAGSHDVEVRFINDAWDGVNDRNLYVGSVKTGNQTVHAVDATNFDSWFNVPSGAEPGAAVLWSNGGLHLKVETVAADATMPAVDADHGLLSHTLIGASSISWA
jgi:beta-glucanase (GH16 family)